MNADRYKAQLSLPEMTPELQEKLKESRIVMVGAGGLGAAALPYLAGAGIGHIKIVDHDVVARHNLHRQTIYRDDQIGKSKAACVADYLRALNPEIHIEFSEEKLTPQNGSKICAGFDLILDGTDNFETKILLNEISIELETPLIGASLERFNALIAVFDGHRADAPCYRCLFPEIPLESCNCSEAGLLGTSAGLAGLYQAHITLCFLLGLNNVTAGLALSADFRDFRLQKFRIEKNLSCAMCRAQTKHEPKAQTMKSISIIQPEEVYASGRLIVDVRTNDEVSNDPIEGAIHMALDSIPARYHELPKDKPIAFACAANVRSMKAAQYVQAMGYDHVCVMNRLP